MQRRRKHLSLTCNALCHGGTTTTAGTSWFVSFQTLVLPSWLPNPRVPETKDPASFVEFERIQTPQFRGGIWWYSQRSSWFKWTAHLLDALDDFRSFWRLWHGLRLAICPARLLLISRFRESLLKLQKNIWKSILISRTERNGLKL